MCFTYEEQAHRMHACIQSGFLPMTVTVQLFPTVNTSDSHAHVHPASIIDGTGCDPAGAMLYEVITANSLWA